MINKKFEHEQHCACWNTRNRTSYREITLPDGKIRAIPVWSPKCEMHELCELGIPHVHWEKPDGYQGEPPSEPGYWNKPQVMGATGWVRQISALWARAYKKHTDIDQDHKARTAIAREADKRECVICFKEFATLDMRYTNCEECRERQRRSAGPFTLQCVGCGKEHVSKFRRTKLCLTCRKIRYNCIE